jgi:hypothetical protein
MRARHVGGFVAVLAVLALLAPGRAAGQGETAGMITELKPGRGRVEVRPAGAPAWTAARPLQALRAGDAVRASADAVAVVLLTAGRGTVRVDAAGSPLTLAAPAAGEGRGQKARALVQAGVGFLAGATRESGQAMLSTRGVARPPVVLSPRNGPVLSDALVFEWNGSRFSRYTVRVLAPGGRVVAERPGVTGASWSYPPEAPRLQAGARYTFQVVGGAQAPQEAWFEVLDAARAQAIRADLAALEQELGAAPPNSLAVMRAGVLAQAGLLHDARLAVAAALARDPDEAALHLLLASLLGRMGLPEQAAEARDEAEFLLTR